MKRLLSILLMSPFFVKGNTVTATVSGGNVNNLSNAQSTYSLADEDVLIIPPTATGYVGVGGIIASAGHYIYVMTTATVTLAGGQLEIGACTNVQFLFHNYGMVINAATRAVVSSAILQGVTVRGVKILDATDYGIYITNSHTYDGVFTSNTHDIWLDSIYMRRHGSADNIIIGGDGTGWVQYLEISNCDIDSSLAGNTMELFHCSNVNVHDNKIYHSGYLLTTTHTNQVGLRGSGDVHDNDFGFNWGNGVRANGTQVVPTGKAGPLGMIRCYNNWVHDSRKYGAFESNNDVSQNDTSSTYLRPVNYYFDYNTVARLRDLDYWDGPPQGGGAVLVDVYKRCSVCDLTAIGNIVVATHFDHGQGLPISYLFHYGDGTPGASDSSNTVYSAHGDDYLVDTLQGITRNPGPAVNAGKRVTYVTNSSNKVARPLGGTSYTIGRQEFLRFQAYIWKNRKYMKLHP